eukprot:CAMPEP_0115219928 /NCGR_PEP_ID=MMETSP0270-20121206/27183_1 /TAXON_ID=71861 /ORGANISM="Scrippsiella trochoidea, Strain CCMP3099" /LENGTH=63 /DNA_ID=CAMNT_0002633965 /DNA_START=1 /DNA_END=189 /DNA_ORIENTATION=+
MLLHLHSASSVEIWGVYSEFILLGEAEAAVSGRQQPAARLDKRSHLPAMASDQSHSGDRPSSQ